jgi:hypothetical protein
MQINLKLDNSSSMVQLYFSKECDTMKEIQAYVSFLNIIYWILLILIVLFIIVVLIYYMQKNDITFNDVYEKTKEYTDKVADWIVNKYYVIKYGANKEREFVPLHSKYSEPEVLDLNIKTSKENNESSNKTDYGGI